MSMNLTSSTRLGVIVLVTLVGVAGYAVAQQRRQEQHPLKTFYPCPRGVCKEVAVRRFVDTDNVDIKQPEFFVDPWPELGVNALSKSHFERLRLDTTTSPGVTPQEKGGRLWVRTSGDLSFQCTRCVNKADVHRDVVQLRVDGACLGEREAIRGIDREGNAACVTIIDIN